MDKTEVAASLGFRVEGTMDKTEVAASLGFRVLGLGNYGQDRGRCLLT